MAETPRRATAPPEPAPVREPDPPVTVITGREGPVRHYPWQTAPAPEPAEVAE